MALVDSLRRDVDRSEPISLPRNIQISVSDNRQLKIVWNGLSVTALECPQSVLAVDYLEGREIAFRFNVNLRDMDPRDARLRVDGDEMLLPDCLASTLLVLSTDIDHDGRRQPAWFTQTKVFGLSAHRRGKIAERIARLDKALNPGGPIFVFRALNAFGKIALVLAAVNIVKATEFACLHAEREDEWLRLPPSTVINGRIVIPDVEPLFEADRRDSLSIDPDALLSSKSGSAT